MNWYIEITGVAMNHLQKLKGEVFTGVPKLHGTPLPAPLCFALASSTKS
jgi:hypothetical protein